MPAGTRTSPLFTAAVNQRAITLHLIDASGDLWTENLAVAVAEPAAEVEAYAAAYAAASQASLYGITDMLGRFGDADPDNAVAGFRGGGQNGINALFKNVTTIPVTKQSLRLVSPVPEVMQGNSDVPLLSATEMSDLILAALALLPSYNFNVAQYTARKERKNNNRVR